MNMALLIFRQFRLNAGEITNRRNSFPGSPHNATGYIHNYPKHDKALKTTDNDQALLYTLVSTCVTQYWGVTPTSSFETISRETKWFWPYKDVLLN